MLIINRQTETATGIIIETGYCIRLNVEHNFSGHTIRIFGVEYVSKEAFAAGKEALKPIYAGSTIPFIYERETDGADILQFAHEKFKQHLIETYGVTPIYETTTKTDEHGNEYQSQLQIGENHYFTDENISIVI
jgi:hypothetical protein